MTRTLKAKIAVDIAMTLALILLMGYMITGDLAHEIIGTVMIILWILHNVLNWKWYTALGKRRYPVKRILNTLINGLLLIAAAGQIISGIMLSSYVFRFLGIETGMGFARALHMVSAYWLFVLSSLHLGMHWSRMAKIMGKKRLGEPSKLRVFLLRLTGVVLAFIGLYAFFKHQLASYMFFRTRFAFYDFEQSPVSFFFEYICIMVLFGAISHSLSCFITKKRTLRRSVCSLQQER